MQQAVSDPVIRYTALGLIAVSFLAFLSVAIHGLWINPNYGVPPFVVGIIGPILGGLLTYIGWHAGANTNSSGVTQGAAVIKNGLAVTALTEEAVHD